MQVEGPRTAGRGALDVDARPKTTTEILRVAQNDATLGVGGGVDGSEGEGLRREKAVAVCRFAWSAGRGRLRGALWRSGLNTGVLRSAQMG